mmetsp:Transcript_35669/g.78097  ORF Transcript_35669/g.78097 Transcript_35669/m.78097 type:complete len:305 (-) Transcript_35669:167-1081(-)
MPCRTTTRRVVPLLGLASLMASILASHHDARGGIANLFRGIFSNHATVQNSVPDYNERRNAQNWRNSSINQADLNYLFDEDEEFVPVFPRSSMFSPNGLFDRRGRVMDQEDPVKNLLVAQDMQGNHEMLIEQMSPEIKAELNMHFFWEDFVFALLQHSNYTNDDDMKLLQAVAFRQAALEYRQCAETCGFHRKSFTYFLGDTFVFLPEYGNFACRDLFPGEALPPRQRLSICHQRYCSICHAELIRVAKKKAESLLEGVSRKAALEGCWDGDGILHQSGGEFMLGTYSCTCSGTREPLCTEKNF